jgi:hypothetical protein
MEREQGESCFWARIIMHMRNMHISIIMLLAEQIRIMTRLLSPSCPHYSAASRACQERPREISFFHKNARTRSGKA